MLRLTDPSEGAVEHADGFVIPEVGDVDDWKTADQCLDVIESGHGLERQGLLDVDHR